MKLFRKKNAQSAKKSPPQTAGPDLEDFYSQPSGQAPLDEHYAGPGGRQSRRTSRHSPGRRRETSNRASSWAIARLLFRTVLIVVLLVGGFFALKFGLERLGEPSDKNQEQWEANATRMEKLASPGAVSAETAVPQELAVSAELIGQRLNQWEQTERHLRSAEALTRRGINDDAEQRLVQALHISPDNKAAQQQLVDIYMKKRRYAEAVPLCLNLLDQDSRQPDLQMNLLQALQGSGQIEAGLVLADRMLQDMPNNQIVLSIVATGQINQGNKAAAVAMFERMLANDPKNKDALNSCATLYFEQKDYQKAVPYYLELVRLYPEPDFYLALAHCYAQQNEADKAVVFMGQAASLFGTVTVAPWLRDVTFDPVRETVEFRSLADRVIGTEARKAVEEINKREAEKATPVAMPGGELQLPNKQGFKAITPGK